MKKIAITGGIGSGKSTVAIILKSWGYPVFSCDEIYQEVSTSPSYIDKIKDIFPSCVIDGKIDRKLLSNFVFSKEENRKKLNAIAHPMIMDVLKEQMDSCKEKFVFAEVPLLFEGNFAHLFDEVIVVTRKKENRILAIMNRDHVDREEAERRLKSQFDYDSEHGKSQLEKYNAMKISNDGSMEELRIKLKDIIEIVKQ